MQQQQVPLAFCYQHCIVKHYENTCLHIMIEYFYQLIQTEKNYFQFLLGFQYQVGSMD